MSINERVKILRRELGLTQKEFGEKITVAQSYLTSIENGKRDVTEKILLLICAVYNVNEEWLRTGEGEVFKTEDDLYEALVDAIGEIDELDKKIIIEYLKLPKEHKKVFKDFIKSITKE